ncbi:PAS domain-containing protein [Kiloniella laminariae]|uniref:PAS domain-containing protein n=1 Tax=Kiloniella laminariae TaxID=454162 RepID=UPI000380D640|nr:PAS domain-containing protein [Kiloniella laminariae]
MGLESHFLTELLAYWNKQAPPGSLPGRKDIDPLDIPQLLPYCELIDVEREPLDFIYRLLGTKIDHITRGKYTGLRVSEIPDQCAPSMIFDLYSQVVSSRKPVRAVLPYVGEKIKIKEVECLVLPLASNGQDVDMLLGGVALSDQEARLLAGL